MVYTAMLNQRGGFESDLTVIRPAGPLPHRHRLGAPRRRLDRPPSAWDEHGALTDVSALYGSSVMGPKARELLAREPGRPSPEWPEVFGGPEIDSGIARAPRRA